MGFRLLSLCFFLYLTLVGSYGFEMVDWESYWHSVLPNSQFPRALRIALQPANPLGGRNIKQTSYPNDANAGTGFAKVGIPYAKAGFAKVGIPYAKAGFAKVGIPYANAASGKVPEVPVGDQTTTYFLRKDLQVGQKMKLYFPKVQNDANFVPRKVAESVPFSSNNLPDILNHYGIKPKSLQAEMVKETIEECEEPAIKGEDKFCATSPESLIDFGVSKLGKRVKVYTTEVEKETKPQEYRIDGKGVQKIGDRPVVCHKTNYVYGVFYCHEIQATTAFMVSLVGSDGNKAKAVALCHDDTRFWNPQHLAFQELKTKPGTVPICHFLAWGNLVWVPN